MGVLLLSNKKQVKYVAVTENYSLIRALVKLDAVLQRTLSNKKLLRLDQSKSWQTMLEYFFTLIFIHMNKITRIK